MPGAEAAPIWAVSFVAPVTRNGATTIGSGKFLSACSSCTVKSRWPSTRAEKFTRSLPSLTFQSSTPSPRTSATTSPPCGEREGAGLALDSQRLRRIQLHGGGRGFDGLFGVKGEGVVFFDRLDEFDGEDLNIVG